MDTWKSSTVIVVATFAVSVLLLFAKASMVRDRSDASGEVVVSNEIYSPAAADPELRSPERAARIREAAQPRPKTVAQRTEAPKPPQRAAPQAGETASAKTEEPLPVPAEAQPGVVTGAAEASPVNEPFPEHQVPAGHDFYVVAATFSSPDNARKGLANMQRKGLAKAFVGTFDEGKFFSVIANTFPREEQARYMVQELERDHGIKGYVYHRRE